jgi:outer membrane receptor protein involved in Fe transport
MSFRKMLAAGVALIAISAPGAFAQGANGEDQASRPSDVVVVTATSGAFSTLESSVSVTTLSADAITDLAPRSTAEVFRSIPGIRSESSGGEGNANIAVRGIPISTGGAKFLQLQEDGLPILEFGDIAFGNADIFARVDETISGVQAVRGGSASVFASNSPGGVINFITETGKRDGGVFSLSRGVDFDSTRGDFRVGGRIADNWYGSIGGFYRQGEGAREAGYTGEKGGQIRASLTREFENGFVRVGFKYLNDRAIGYLPSPIRVTGTDGDPSWGPLPGYDAATQTLHSALFQRSPGLDGANAPRVSDISDGMRPETLAFSSHINFDLPGEWTIENKTRIARNEGRFVSPFTASTATAAATATSIGGAGATARFANGASAGQPVPAGVNGNGLVASVVLFDTEINDFGNFGNDLSLSRSFALGGGDLSAKFGYYRAAQTIDMDWLWNSYLLEVKGDNAALIDIFSAAGTKLTQNGLVGYGATFFGNCCRRSYDTQYDIDAPYASFTWTSGPLIIDAGIRGDFGRATGSYTDGIVTTRDLSGDGVIQRPETLVTVIDFANTRPVDYEWDYTSYSIGANYSVSDSVAVFGRFSRGGRANADRLLFGPAILASGDIRSDDAAVDMVDQYEAGVRFVGGDLSVFATAFLAQTEETNFEATSQTFTDAEYESKGIELEGFYSIGGFDLSGGVTYTDAEITKDALNPANVGNTPRRQADWVYQATGSYASGPFRVGASLVGTSDSFAQFNNQLVMPGYVVVNPFASYDIAEGLQLVLNINNVFDEFAVTEAEEGSIPASGIVRARTLNGRTTTVGLRYAF